MKYEDFTDNEYLEKMIEELRGSRKTGMSNWKFF